MEKIIIAQFIVLLLGTLFAWSNFVIEFVAWRRNKSCSKTGCSDGSCATTSCSGGKIINPFLTPCFYGAIFFTIAFVLSVILLN